jgi:hypothetical protein
MLLASAAALGAVIPAAAQGGAASGAAPSPEAIAAANELIAVVSPDMVKDITSKLFSSLWPQMEKDLRAQNPQLDAATLDKVKTEIGAVLGKEVGIEVSSMKETMPAVYAKYLTVQEMRDILAFYRTPAGAKALQVMPQIMGESMGQFGPRMQVMLQRVSSSVVDILKKYDLGPK